MDDILKFLQTSPIAKNTKPDSCVVLKRMRMSPAELLEIKKSGQYTATGVNTRSCDLEIGGQVVAAGRIVRRRGKSYLLIARTKFDEGYNGEENGNE